jgi:glycosyltransferase involved in cell wall biosynthesis
MKTVLLIAQYYPPCVHTASKRAGGFAKYLGEFGWRPVLLCPEWTPENCLYDPEFVTGIPESVPVFRVPIGMGTKWSVERASDLLEAELFANWRSNSFLRRARERIPEIFNEYSIDAIWSTWPAAGPNLLAAGIAGRYRRPWVADFRDIIGNVYVNRMYSVVGPVRLFLQKRYLRRAAALVTISEAHGRVLEVRHGKPVYIIPNGFDPDDLAATDRPALDKFLLLYTGIFSTGEHTNFRVVLDAIARLAKGGGPSRPSQSGYCAAPDAIAQAAGKGSPPSRSGLCVGGVNPDDFELEFMGRGVERRVEVMFAGHELRRLARASGPVARRACLARQRAAAVLLQNTFPGRQGVMTGKIFEYLAARRPILAIPRDHDCIDRVLEETGAGASCTTVEEVADRLRAWYAEWKATGTVVGRGRVESIMKYSRKAEAEELAKVLDAVVKDGGLGEGKGTKGT